MQDCNPERQNGLLIFLYNGNKIKRLKKAWMTLKQERGGKMAEVRKHIVFHGRVQGVGFRYTAKYLAQSLRLTGWVKNEWDGTVSMEVQGREPMINKLLAGLNRGQFITIDWMDTEEIPLKEENSFSVR